MKLEEREIGLYKIATKSKIQFPNGDFKNRITVASGHASFPTIPVEKTISPRDAEKSVPGYFSSISPFYFF